MERARQVSGVTGSDDKDVNLARPIVAGTGIEHEHGGGPKLPPGLVVLHLILKLFLLIGFVFLGCLIARFFYFCIFGKPQPDGEADDGKGGGASSRGRGGGGGGAASADSSGSDSHRVVTMRCTIPEGMGPGQQLTWLSPSGTLVAMTIPQGSEAGQMLEFPVPAAVLRPNQGGAAPPAAAQPAAAQPAAAQPARKQSEHKI
tara:strand:- start:88 stop:693 length:606 start_codon:yes stop_codon:yes gene_type:complete